MPIRAAAVAGTWYPDSASALRLAVEGHLARRRPDTGVRVEELVGLIAPHAGLMYSGPIAAHAYDQLRDRAFDVIVMVGPSHFVGFQGVSIYPEGSFRTPLGDALIDESCAAAVLGATPIVRALPAPHAREHSLEMQLPFVQLLSPEAKIVPLLMGSQSADTSRELGEALGRALAGRKALLVASSDLSHYHDAMMAASLDDVVVDHVGRFDVEGLQRALESRPDHACGGGPMVAVMRAAFLLGAGDAIVLRYGDSGDVSGDKSSVVGYMAAALGNLTRRTA
jgi:AmmeMemoRadiSam system protein B